MLLSLMDKLNCLVAKEKINVFGKSVMDISSLVLRADLCGLTAARNAIIDRFDTRKLYVKRTSLRTKLRQFDGDITLSSCMGSFRTKNLDPMFIYYNHENNGAGHDATQL